MSHFTVMVIGNNPEDQLAPYDENIQMPKTPGEIVIEEEKQRFMEYYIKENEDEKSLSFEQMYEKHGDNWNGNCWEKNSQGEWWDMSTYNPDSKWDWYQLGGRWSGEYIKLKKDTKAIAIGEPGVFGNKTGVDAALKGDIDWNAIRNEAEEDAGTKWDEVHKHLEDNKVDMTYIAWSTLRDQYKDDIDTARKLYGEQEIVKSFNELNKDNKYAGFMGDGVTPYLVSREKYVKSKGDGSFSTFAVVKDYKWYEKGEMGWWGMASNEKEQDTWNQQVWKLLEGLPDDALISIYDCHI